jgi:hypothetical protein
VKLSHNIRPVMLVHEIQIRKRIIVVPLVASAAHGITVTVSQIKPNDEIATAVEV